VKQTLKLAIDETISNDITVMQKLMICAKLQQGIVTENMVVTIRVKIKDWRKEVSALQNNFLLIHPQRCLA
jgi:hypothetical protein